MKSNAGSKNVFATASDGETPTLSAVPVSTSNTCPLFGGTQWAAVNTKRGEMTVPEHRLPVVAPGAWMNTATTEGSPSSITPPMIDCSSLAIGSSPAEDGSGKQPVNATDDTDRN